MADATLDELIETALRQHQAGNLKEAQELCMEIVERDPGCAAAWHLQAILLSRMGRYADAIPLLERAAALAPEAADYLVNLGQCYHAAGRAAEAIEVTQRAVALQPQLANAHYNLGTLLLAAKRLTEAQAAFGRAHELAPFDALSLSGLGKAHGLAGDLAAAARAFLAAVELEPWDADHWFNVGLAWQRLGLREDARRAFERVVAIKPSQAAAWSSLGIELRGAGRVPESATALQRAVALRGDDAEAWNDLAISLGIIGRNEEALAAVQTALRLRPAFPEAQGNLGKVLQQLDRHAAAAEAYRALVSLGRDTADAHGSLATSLHALGRVDEALAEYRAAIARRPDHAGASSNLLFALQFSAATTAEDLQREHTRWRDQFERPLVARRRDHAGARDANRRLRIGYLSADLREHAVSFFIAPILAHADHQSFEIICYSDAIRTDATTSRLRRSADAWHDTHALSDEHLAGQIAADGVDLLVDLSVHSAGNRLRAFALKPAPIQLSYLGYCGTTGVSAIDYRITDEVVDPPGATELWSSEKLLRLPRSFCCYTPPASTPAVAPSPGQKSSHVTFGAFNTLAKTTPAMLDLWARLLREVPDAKLIFLSRTFAEASVRERVLAHFVRQQIAADRIELLAGVSLAEYLALFHRVDIALDTFPFNGHTTTCHAMWMGVPTITLTGSIPVSRVGASLLRHVGLERLATISPADYVTAAATLASHPGELAAIRRDLRRRLEKSALMDARALAGDLEEAYRRVWKDFTLLTE